MKSCKCREGPLKRKSSVAIGSWRFNTTRCVECPLSCQDLRVLLDLGGLISLNFTRQDKATGTEAEKAAAAKRFTEINNGEEPRRLAWPATLMAMQVLHHPLPCAIHSVRSPVG